METCKTALCGVRAPETRRSPRRRPALDLAPYPGGDLVAQGVADLARGAVTEEALLVALAAPRLRDLGFDVPDLPGVLFPHHALIDRIVSFANAYRPFP